MRATDRIKIEDQILRHLAKIDRFDFENTRASSATKSYVIGYVLPVHDNEICIEQVLDSLYQNTSLPFRLVVILDACNDGSPEIVLNWVKKAITSTDRIINITLLKSTTMLHETLSDNIGFFLLKQCEIVVDIQADILVYERDFDRKIKKIFENFPDIVAVSGRGCHLWELPYNPRITPQVLKEILKDIVKRHFNASISESKPSITFELSPIRFFADRTFGRLDENVENKADISGKIRTVWLSETVMRGPLAIRNSIFEEIGYLNSRAHPLAGDDHEFFLRAWKEKGFRTCYVPIAYESPLRFGNDRRKKPWRDEFFAVYLRLRMWIHSSESEFRATGELLDVNRPQKELREIDFSEFDSEIKIK